VFTGTRRHLVAIQARTGHANQLLIIML